MKIAKLVFIEMGEKGVGAKIEYEGGATKDDVCGEYAVLALEVIRQAVAEIEKSMGDMGAALPRHSKLN